MTAALAPSHEQRNADEFLPHPNREIIGLTPELGG